MRPNVIECLGRVDRDSSYQRFLLDSKVDSGRSFWDQVWYWEKDWQPIVEVHESIDDDAKEWLVEILGFKNAMKIINEL